MDVECNMVCSDIPTYVSALRAQQSFVKVTHTSF